MKKFYINYQNDSKATGQLTQAQIPATWGDISFVLVYDYLKNTKRFCPEDTTRYFTVNYDKVLCTNVRPQSIEEKSPAKIVVRGSLGDLINGSGLRDQDIEIDILDSTGFPAMESLIETTGSRYIFLVFI